MIKFMKIWDKLGVWLVIFVMVCIFSVGNPNFLTVYTLTNVLKQSCVLGVAALGYGMLLISGVVNLSTGSIIGMGAVLGCVMMLAGVPMILAIILVVVLCAILSMLDGVLAQKLRVGAFLMTLATQSVWRGVAQTITKGKTLYGLPEELSVLGQGVIFGFLPVSILVLAACFLLVYFILNRTYFGRHIYANGGNLEASYLTGINVKRVQTLTHICAGALLGVSAILMLSRNMVANGNMGSGYEFECLTAAVLGGVSLGGGVGKIQNLMLGVLALGIMTTGLQMMSISSFMETTIKGLLLIFAVTMDYLRTRAMVKSNLANN